MAATRATKAGVRRELEADVIRAWTVEIPGWHPPRVNDLMYTTIGARIGRKKQARRVVGNACLVHAIPKAAGKRRVTLTIVLGPRQRGGDVDAYWKSLLDALKDAGAIVGDSREWAEIAPVEYERAAVKGTRIRLEDLT